MNFFSPKKKFILNGIQFIIQNPLGQGAFGSISKVINKQNGLIYAIKMVPINSQHSQQTLKNQIQKLINLPPSPYIISILPYSMYSKRFYYMIMDYCAQGDITSEIHTYICNNQEMSQDKVKNLIHDVAKGYQLLLQQNILHLDIKPQNILKKKKRYALADFGFAIYNDKNVKSSSGTIEYLAPQRMFQGHKLNSKQDMYAFGITVCQFSNKFIHPYIYNLNSSRLVDIYHEILKVKPNISKHLSVNLIQIIKKMIQVDVKKRLSWEELLYIVNNHEMFKNIKKSTFEMSLLLPQYESGYNKLLQVTQIIVNNEVEKEENKNLEFIYKPLKEVLSNKIDICIYLAKVIDTIQIHKYLAPNQMRNQQRQIQQTLLDYMKQFINSQIKMGDLKMQQNFVQKMMINVQMISQQYKKIISINNKIRQFRKKLGRYSLWGSQQLQQIRLNGLDLIQKILNKIQIVQNIKFIYQNSRNSYLWTFLLYNFQILVSFFNAPTIVEKYAIIKFALQKINLLQQKYDNQQIYQLIQQYKHSGKFIIQIQQDDQVFQIIDDLKIITFNNIGKYPPLYQ